MILAFFPCICDTLILFCNQKHHQNYILFYQNNLKVINKNSSVVFHIAFSICVHSLLK